MVSQQEPEEIPENTQKEAPVLPKTGKKVASNNTLPSPATARAASIASFRELPEAIQQQIPSFKVGGYIYSTTKSERSVLINNRLLNEGDEVAPGLILERMQPDGMVMNYKGYQYRMSY